MIAIGKLIANQVAVKIDRYLIGDLPLRNKITKIGIKSRTGKNLVATETPSAIAL